MINWTPELEDEIAALLVNSSLRAICKDRPDLPSRESIRLRQIEHEAFWAKCARAMQAHALQRIEDAGQIADDCTEENVDSSKVKISFAQWTAEKLLPKTFAGKTPGDSPENPLHLKVDREEAIAKLIGSGDAAPTA